MKAIARINRDLGDFEPLDAETRAYLLSFNRGREAPSGCLGFEGYADFMVSQAAESFQEHLEDMRTLHQILSGRVL